MSLINTIVCGDCREILPTLPAKSFQLAFADPPYWVGFDYGNKTDKEMAYIEPEFLVNELLRVANCVLITPGNGNQHLYPVPLWQVAWLKPSSHSYNKLKGGFAKWEPILVYGDIPKPVYLDTVTASILYDKSIDFHSCPKPIKLLNWVVENFSNPGDKVIDPVSGSGTTCKAAFQLGREYLGIEIDPNIVELSLKRLSESQPPLLGMGRLTKRAADGGNAAPEFSNFE